MTGVNRRTPHEVLFWGLDFPSSNPLPAFNPTVTVNICWFPYRTTDLRAKYVSLFSASTDADLFFSGRASPLLPEDILARKSASLCQSVSLVSRSISDSMAAATLGADERV